MSTTAIALVEPKEIANYAIFSPDVDIDLIRETIAENMAGDDMTVWDLPRVKCPSGGITTFTVPTPDGEIETKEILGIVAFNQVGRSWWEVSMEESGGGSAPDCSSVDGLTGTKFGDCSGCPKNEFGSARKGEGKDCKETRSLFLLTKDGALPLVVSVPPTSLKPFKTYRSRLMSAMVPVSGCITRITLKKAKNAKGIEYAEMEFSRAGNLTKDQRQQIAAYANALKDSFVKAHKTAVYNGAAASNHSQDSYEPMPEDNPYGDVE